MIAQYPPSRHKWLKFLTPHRQRNTSAFHLQPAYLIGELSAILVALVGLEVAVVLLAAVEAPVGVVERKGLGLAARRRVADESGAVVGVQDQLGVAALLAAVVRRSQGAERNEVVCCIGGALYWWYINTSTRKGLVHNGTESGSKSLDSNTYSI